MPAAAPLLTLLSQALVAFTIELDNEFERRLVETGLRARVVSLVMWSNFLRVVGDGVAVGDLPEAAGLPRARMLSTVGGMERWGYVAVGPETRARRDGFGSGRGLRADWVVRPTAAGRAAGEIWAVLPAEVDERWEGRFGREAIAELRGSLRATLDAAGAELPEYLPIVGGANGMRAEVAAPRRPASTSHLAALLAQVLLALTLDVERESELSLPLSANVVRVLDADGTSARDVAGAAGVSGEAVSMALTFLVRAGLVAVEGKVARLTPTGVEARAQAERVQRAVERRWRDRDGVARLRAALAGVVGPRLAEGLEPPPGGWRAGARYAERTRAVLADPVAALPHYPTVLHRGGWPDGS